MPINWKTVEKDGTPQPKFGKPIYITCIVWVANPDILRGGIPETCSWDIKNNEWLKSDVNKIWCIGGESNCIITHYCDDFNIPVSN